jgi:hypothetical protein
MPLVFMYGPDTLQRRMFDRIGPTDVRGPAVLSGYALAFDKPNLKDKREGLPNLQEAEDAEAFGVVFDIPAKQFDMLDGFFGGYEQRRVRPAVLPPEPEAPETEGIDGTPPQERRAPTPVTATAWIARRTAKRLRPSAASFEATVEGMEENGAPGRFIEALKELNPLPSDTIELMVQFERGFEESEARTLMEAAGGTIRRRMRTDHEDQVQLLVKLPRDRLEVIEQDLDKHPKVTLVERNEGGYGIL